MSDAERAYEAAEKEIAEARKDGRTELDFDSAPFRALEILPDSIAELTALRVLDLDKTQISDVSPLSGLTALTRLWLNRTQVSDVSPLSGLTALTVLWLNGTQVRDVSALSGLTALTRLWLNRTQVSDVSPLSGLTALTGLGLDGTQVGDVSPLSGLTALDDLWLNRSDVRDLRPLRGLTALAENPQTFGLTIEGCAAAREDPKIAEIAGIKDNVERARSLFTYLKDWEPSGDARGANAETPSLPNPGLAPLQADIVDGRLVRVGSHGLPETDAIARAEAGWASLKAYRETFRKSCNIGNHGQLVAVLEGFDAAMGEAFDADRLILIGSMGSAVVALSDDAELANELPTGVAALLRQFAVQIETFVNRFPDWVLYREEAMHAQITVENVRAEEAAFRAWIEELEQSAETDPEVAEDFSIQVEGAMHDGADLVVSQGLVASSREVVRALGEQAIEELQSGRLARGEVDAMDGVHDEELAKWKWRFGGFAVVMLRRRSGPLRRLAARFPAQMGWLHRVLDYIGADQDNPGT